MAIFSGEKAESMEELGVAAGSVRDNVCVGYTNSTGTLGPPTWRLLRLLHLRMPTLRFSATAQRPCALSYRRGRPHGPPAQKLAWFSVLTSQP